MTRVVSTDVRGLILFGLSQQIRTSSASMAESNQRFHGEAIHNGVGLHKHLPLTA